jgi:hypothetical protein
MKKRCEDHGTAITKVDHLPVQLAPDSRRNDLQMISARLLVVQHFLEQRNLVALPGFELRRSRKTVLSACLSHSSSDRQTYRALGLTSHPASVANPPWENRAERDAPLHRQVQPVGSHRSLQYAPEEGSVLIRRTSCFNVCECLGSPARVTCHKSTWSGFQGYVPLQHEGLAE